jgi:hypothetical protein
MRRRLSLRWVRLRLAGLCRLRRLRSPVLLVQGWLQRLLDRGAYGDVNRPGRLDRLGQRPCGTGSRKRRAVAPLRFACNVCGPHQEALAGKLLNYALVLGRCNLALATEQALETR